MREVSLNHPYIRILKKRLGRPKVAPNNQVRFNSPFVPSGKRSDIGHHLYVNVEGGKFFCFRSSSGGSLSYLFAVLGEKFTESPELPLSPLTELKSRAYAITSEERFSKPMAGLPEEYSPVRQVGRVYRYLRRRGLNDDDISFYKIGEGEEEYDGWAIIPSFDQYGRCEYWVARNTDEDAWGAKYDNPQAARKYHISFLTSALENSDDGSIILCEGVFSAIIAGRTAAASFGKFVTNNQFSTMQRAGVSRLRICLDGDAWKETLDVARRALGCGMGATIIPMPVDKDPADMGRRSYFEHLKKNEFAVTRTDLMRLKLEDAL